MDKDHISMLSSEFELPLAGMGLPTQGPVRLLGEILGEQINLSISDIHEILAHADLHGTRFGDAALALGHASADQVFRALATQFQYPCSGPDPRLDDPSLVMLARPDSRQAEAIRAIRGQVSRRLSRLPDSRVALAVVSPDSGDGKTFLVANLGIALAQVGHRTLLVDADLRSPRLHERFQLRGAQGLSSALSGRTDAQLIQGVSGVPGLFVLPGGIAPPNPLELIERNAFRTLMQKLPQHFDHVIVDTPAVSDGADAHAIADRCQANLLVGRRHHAGMHALSRLADELSDPPGRLIGMIVNDF